ncbi:MAG: pentapeptide repeat-containing protein [Lewinellaceae bacterium]|nr:pentapeptide repeat-containing protein [Lewinellaceae bacterium]
MDATWIDQSFSEEDFALKPFPVGRYEQCVFSGCTFTEANLQGSIFLDCRFERCDLSMANLSGVALRDVQFEECKLLGLRFDDCNPMGLALTFNACQLNFASFYQVNLSGITFTRCQLQEVEFVEADLSGAIFAHCDLTRAIFRQTNLQRTDFRTALNFTIDPEVNRIKGARFSAAGALQLLEKYQLEIT